LVKQRTAGNSLSGSVLSGGYMTAWALVFHIIGLVFWLGSLLLVTSILAIHAEEASTESRATLTVVESKLLKGFAHPGAALMVITGFILLTQHPENLREPWLHAKLALVAILIGLDLRVTMRAKALQEGKVELTRGECMALHGSIALAFFIIVILAFVRPFGTPRSHTQVGAANTPTVQQSTSQ
jgi:protoporphyrinogen IX oxidase